MCSECHLPLLKELQFGKTKGIKNSFQAAKCFSKPLCSATEKKKKVFTHNSERLYWSVFFYIKELSLQVRCIKQNQQYGRLMSFIETLTEGFSTSHGSCL